MIYSFIIDDAPQDVSRQKVRETIDEAIRRPFDPEAAFFYDQMLWEKKNVESMEQAGVGVDDDPWLAQPVAR